MCFDGIKRLCHIRGKLRKRQWINKSGQSQISRVSQVGCFIKISKFLRTQ